MNDSPCSEKEASLTLEVNEAIEVLKKHQTKQGVFQHTHNLAQRIKSVMEEYDSTARKALRCSKEFRDRMIIDLRAMTLVLTMVGNASTHKEKDSRLRGCIEILEGAITRLERESFDINLCNQPHFDDVFRSDYPTRHYLERIRELEESLKALQAVPAPANEVPVSETKAASDDTPF